MFSWARFRTPLLLAALGVIAGCPRPSGEVSTGNDAIAASPQCAKDSDCVPATCCHANACVPRAQAPSCRGQMCTMLCMPHTIDCGGGCLCVAGKCGARLSDDRGVVAPQ